MQLLTSVFTLNDLIWIIPALTEYLLVYLPFFLLWICALLIAVTNWQPPALTWLSILIACLGAGFAGASTLFYYLRARPVQIEKSAAEASSEAARWPKTTHLSVLTVVGCRWLFLIAKSLSGWSRRFRESLVFAAQSCLQSVVTLLLLIPYISVMGALGQWQDPRGIALLIVILVVHFLANIGRIGRVKSGAACMVMLLFFLLQTGSVSSFGAISLRWLGIGGGIPCDITLRTFDPPSGQPVVNVERGCLLMTTGNEVALHPDKNAAAGACALGQVLGHKNDTASPWSVDIYPQSEIVKISILTQRIQTGGS